MSSPTQQNPSVFPAFQPSAVEGNEIPGLEKQTGITNSHTKPKHSYTKNPTSLGEEFLIYQNAAAEASEQGNQKLADRWNLAAHLVLKFAQYRDSSNQLSLIIEFAEQITINDRTIEAQEIAQYTTSALAAFMNHDITLAQKLIGYAQETKEVGVRCRHWLTLIKQEIASHHALQEPTFDEAAIQYRANALKATQTGESMIAQHCSEAACLAQEAARKQALCTSAYVTSGNEMLFTYWKLSRDASYDAAKIKAQVALALEQGNKILAQKYDDLALLAEKLSSYRENLVRSIISGEVMTTPHWRNAVRFLSESLNTARSLVSAPEEMKPLASYQKEIVLTAEQAAESHNELISKLQKKKSPSFNSILYAEKSYEEAVQALQYFQQHDLLSATTSKKQSTLYGKAYQLSKKIAHAKEKWYILGVSFLYWKYQLKKIDRMLRKI